MKKGKKINYLVYLFICIFSLLKFHQFISSSELNGDEFQREGNYSKEMLLLFADIAFDPNKIVRKWEKDIKVQIVNESYVDDSSIQEVDSIIKILSPLIYPTKIYRVSENGNLKVHRKVEEIKNKKNAIGTCYISPPTKFSCNRWAIKDAEVYDLRWIHGVKTILHEFEHALGLQHPSKQYPFYMNIVGVTMPHVFKSLEEADSYNSIPYYLSEEEKQVIRMLYSPHIKSGLKKESFLKTMKLKDNDK